MSSYPDIADRLGTAKWAYTTARIPRAAAAGLLTDAVPEAGDLTLARVRTLGQHRRVELPTGRKADLFPGDEIVVCFGARYAPDQFEAVVPTDLGPCHLVAAGGVAGRALSRHASLSPATEIDPVGILVDADGKRINLERWALDAPGEGRRPGLVLAVLGTSMNSGKTTTAAAAVRGLTRSGLRVGAAKVTGTGAGGDPWLLADSGAHPVLDFTHAGLPTTYQCSPERVRSVFLTILDHLAGSGVDAAVIEVADGLCQQETSDLVQSSTFRRCVDGVVFAAGEAMGAAAGAAWLEERSLPVIGISGTLTGSPLASREAAALTGLPLLSIAALEQPGLVADLVAHVPSDELVAAGVGA